MRAMMNRSLNDYMMLPYTIEVIPDDGAWFVQIRELPGCMTEVDEWDEILPAIEDAKRLWIELALERGRPIPEPMGVVR
jgi:antitoxin HicB